LPQQQVSKTLWNEEEQSKEDEMIKVLQSDGVWTEMEEGFKAHQLVVNLMGMGSTQFPVLRLIWSTARQKRAELKSVLDPQTKKRVGMYLLLPVFQHLLQ
jgi:cytokinesis protein